MAPMGTMIHHRTRIGQVLILDIVFLVLLVFFAQVQASSKVKVNDRNSKCICKEWFRDTAKYWHSNILNKATVGASLVSFGWNVFSLPYLKGKDNSPPIIEPKPNDGINGTSTADWLSTLPSDGPTSSSTIWLKLVFGVVGLVITAVVLHYYFNTEHTTSASKVADEKGQSTQAETNETANKVALSAGKTKKSVKPDADAGTSKSSVNKPPVSTKKSSRKSTKSIKSSGTPKSLAGGTPGSSTTTGSTSSSPGPSTNTSTM